MALHSGVLLLLRSFFGFQSCKNGTEADWLLSPLLPYVFFRFHELTKNGDEDACAHFVWFVACSYGNYSHGTAKQLFRFRRTGSWPN